MEEPVIVKINTDTVLVAHAESEDGDAGWEVSVRDTKKDRSMFLFRKYGPRPIIRDTLVTIASMGD